MCALYGARFARARAYIHTYKYRTSPSPGLVSHIYALNYFFKVINTLHVMRTLSISRDGVVRLLYMIRMSAREDVGRAKTVFSQPVLSLYIKSLRSYK